MPKPLYHTTREQDPQAGQSEDDWSKQVLARLAAHLEEQAKKRHPPLSAVGRSALQPICCGDCWPMCTQRILFNMSACGAC